MLDKKYDHKIVEENKYKEWLEKDSEIRLSLLRMYRNYTPFTEETFNSKLVIASTVPATNQPTTVVKNEVKVVKDEELYKEYLATKEYLDNVLNSTSWKITAPLRKFIDKLKGKGKE